MIIKLTLKRDKTTILINLNNIELIKTSEGSTYLYPMAGGEYVVDESLEEIEKLIKEAK